MTPTTCCGPTGSASFPAPRAASMVHRSAPPETARQTAVLEHQAALVQALCRPGGFPHPAPDIRHLETHISHVLLTGTYAYKIKKPVNLGFLDFSTLERRRHYCREEVRLNRRLAAELYCGVVPIAGPSDAPLLDGPGPALEYAVKMREFPQNQLWDQLLAAGQLAPRHIDALARRIAAFHAGCAVAAPNAAWGTPESVLQAAEENFPPLLAGLPDPALRQAALELQRWNAEQHRRLTPLFQRRRQQGRVRECHGDLHLANIVLHQGEPTAFDCIEFSDALRWIDVASEVAFLVMDLAHRGRDDLGRRFLNGYLEASGDIGGLPGLRYYCVYRALVRAKVAAIRAAQPGTGRQPKITEECAAYLDLAQHFAASPRPALIITHGAAGCGKTTFTGVLLEALDGIRLRSDVERKRLHGLGPEARSGSGMAQGIYGEQATRRLYQTLRDQARVILDAGWTAIVDATCLFRWQRELFRSLAQDMRMPFLILDFPADPALLRERVARRHAAGTDASEADLAVLARQLARREPLQPAEQGQALAVTAADKADLPAVIQQLTTRFS